jgi:hypothetical protein
MTLKASRSSMTFWSDCQFPNYRRARTSSLTRDFRCSQTANLYDRILDATLEGLNENRLDLHHRFKESWRLHTYQGLC